MLLHNDQVLMINTIVNIIVQLLIDDNIISEYNIKMENNKLCNIIKKIYIMNNITNVRISEIGSVINLLIDYFDDTMVIKTNIISPKSELDKISVLLYEKYNQLYIDEILNKYTDDCDNIYLIHKLYIKYNIDENILETITDKINFLKGLAYINNNITSTHILEYLYINIKYIINNIYNINYLSYNDKHSVYKKSMTLNEKNNIYRKYVYLICEHMQILVSYLFSSNNNISDVVKNSSYKLLNNILIPHKNKINNIWEYNNNKLYVKLKIFKNTFNANDIMNNILFDIDINSDNNKMKSPTFIAINLKKYKNTRKNIFECLKNDQT